MLEGVVPFPPEFAQRYRARGYWQDKSLAAEFAAVWRSYAERVALVEGERQYSYADIDRITDNLALNLIELGLKPLDRVVPTLPNVAEFVLLYFALQKVGCVPIAALVSHRYAEISQFVQLSGAVACVYPEGIGDYRFSDTVARVQKENPQLKFRIVLGQAGPGEVSLVDLIEPPRAGRRASWSESTSIRPIRRFSSSRAAPPASPSSSRARTTTTRTTRRPQRRCAA